MAGDCALFIITIPNDQITDNNNTKDAPDTLSSMCVRLKNYFIDQENIKPVWILSADQKSYQITFHAEFGNASDQILCDLNQREIGIKCGSQVCVVPATVVVGFNDNINSNIMNTGIESDRNLAESSHSLPRDNSTLKGKMQKHIDTNKFKKSVRARLMVHQVVAAIRAATELSFDFIVLLSLASMIAAFGLLENSSVIIVASMLVSPLMNPIMGIVFGLSVREHSLWRRGIRNELIGLVLCILWGFVIGLCTTHFETRWGSSTSFPTSEMKGRGDLKRLWVGVLIALPSGAGVALSVLGGNTGSLVGVAISASLLPPAVNCGLLLSYAILSHAVSHVNQANTSNGSDPQTTLLYFAFQNRLRPNDPIINCSRYIDNDYLPYYSCYMPNEAAILGSCSLLLTIVNILCIIVMALIILRIKEVAPLHQTSKEIADFFHHNVKVARDYNKTINENDTDYNKTTNTPTIGTIVLSKSIAKHWRGMISSSKRQIPPTVAAADQPNRSFNLNSLTDLHHLQTYAGDFDLDVFCTEDRELMTPESEEKVLYLVRNLLDMFEEDSSTLMDLFRYQPYGLQTSVRDEHISFYEKIIQLLPPKWHDIFERERHRRINNIRFASKQTSSSFSALSPRVFIPSRLNHSYNGRHKENWSGLGGNKSELNNNARHASLFQQQKSINEPKYLDKEKDHRNDKQQNNIFNTDRY